MFKDAAKRGLITASPFSELIGGSDANDENSVFVDRQTVDRVIATVEDPHWRLLIALSRYGGLRIPSEIQTMRWADVDFVGKRIIIHSRKTKRIRGKARRTMPMFPELVPYLVEARASHSGEYVFPDELRLHTNPGTTFQKILKRTGVAPWPRQFHNLRASRETELANEYIQSR